MLIRELKTRFWCFKLGYLGAVLEPIIGIVGLYLIRVAMGSDKIAGLEFPIFFASGMLIYSQLRKIGTAAIGVVESNLSPMNYQRIKPMDPIV